ncbi:hypothetical protein DL764_005737 [Monosporascus ibericus]|uniref:ATPase AAA-type core domain-containing protein n=1 Tax=Monosporascus ibericus TaxID=155417 RepID=A0A4Q4T7X9_9PEZI|nr:hypothetical protein DL764_005737 [Monosporascus ibericus]
MAWLLSGHDNGVTTKKSVNDYNRLDRFCVNGRVVVDCKTYYQWKPDYGLEVEDLTRTEVAKRQRTLCKYNEGADEGEDVVFDELPEEDLVVTSPTHSEIHFVDPGREDANFQPLNDRGIIFLTTNRVSTFDDAFTSRIHLPLHYPNLSESSRVTIWLLDHSVIISYAYVFYTNATSTIASPGERTSPKSSWIGWPSTMLKGRQIKNIVKFVETQAMFECPKLDAAQLEEFTKGHEELQSDWMSLVDVNEFSSNFEMTPLVKMIFSSPSLCLHRIWAN